MCPVNNCVLPVGALVVIKGQDPLTITNQSIIVFKSDPTNPDFLVIHRVVGIVPSQTSAYGEVSFETKGDANIPRDTWTQYGYIPGSWVVGVYQFTIPIPYLGSAILAIRNFMYNSQGQVNPQGILIILALVVALFAFEVATPPKKKPSDKEASADSPRADAPSAPESPAHSPSDG